MGARREPVTVQGSWTQFRVLFPRTTNDGSVGLCGDGSSWWPIDVRFAGCQLSKVSETPENGPTTVTHDDIFLGLADHHRTTQQNPIRPQQADTG